jgi:hypothetical protein
MGTPRNFKPKPLKENPRGFFENFEFRILNDVILAHSGYNVKAWNPQLGQVKERRIHRIRMKGLIRKYSRQYLTWGWKDPRQTLTCDRWLAVLRDLELEHIVRLIFVYRHPLSVALSMIKRGNIEIISHGLALWYLYNQRALDCISESCLPCLVLSFENVFENPSSVLADLSRFAGKAIDQEIFDGFVSPSLVRSDFAKLSKSFDTCCDRKVTDLLERLTALESREGHYRP